MLGGAERAGPVAAHVVERAQLAVVIDDDEHVPARELVGDDVAGLSEVGAEGGELPLGREDGVALGGVPTGVVVGDRGECRRRDRIHRCPSLRSAAHVRSPLMEITEVMAERGHEQVVLVADAATDLRAVIAVHSTALGPSLGGIRFWHYATETDALTDVLRLSEAMSLKAAAAGLHQGGGKAVVRWSDPHRPRTPDQLQALGRAIHELGGRYIAAEDVGATTADMDGIGAVTPWVTGVSESTGGSGDPSPVTAVGVHAAMRAAAQERWGDASLTGRHVVVQGAGKVGAGLARLLVADGARGLDRRRRRCARARVGLGARRGTGPRRRRALPAGRRRGAVRARWCAHRDGGRRAGVHRGLRRRQQPARHRRGRRRARPPGRSSTRPTSSPTPAGSSTSPRSSWATHTSAPSRRRVGSRRP